MAYCPEKIPKVDSIWRRNRGNEEQLFHTLYELRGVPVERRTFHLIGAQEAHEVCRQGAGDTETAESRNNDGQPSAGSMCGPSASGGYLSNLAKRDESDEVVPKRNLEEDTERWRKQLEEFCAI